VRQRRQRFEIAGAGGDSSQGVCAGTGIGPEVVGSEEGDRLPEWGNNVVTFLGVLPAVAEEPVTVGRRLEGAL
jgi:hypothetical protein